MVTTVYLIRHAQAEGNVNGVFQGHYNGAVSETGCKQLEQLAEYAKALPLDAIYASPLDRAVETAKAVNKYCGLSVQIEDGLIEINGGDWEGKSWDSFFVDFPEQYEHWRNKPWLFEAPNGETMAQVYGRVTKTLLKLVKANEGKTFAAVSHGCSIRNLVAFAKGDTVEGIGNTGWCDNTAICKLEFEGGKPRLIYENDTGHLAEETKTFARQRKGDEPKNEEKQ